MLLEKLDPRRKVVLIGTGQALKFVGTTTKKGEKLFIYVIPHDEDEEIVLLNENGCQHGSNGPPIAQNVLVEHSRALLLFRNPKNNLVGADWHLTMEQALEAQAHWDSVPSHGMFSGITPKAPRERGRIITIIPIQWMEKE